MFHKNHARRLRAARRGQSIVVALLVLLLLGLAGALFVTIIAKNVLNARHASRVITADQYGRAGITFADAQLSSSLDGADWRPPLQFKLLNPPTEARELARYTAAVTANNLAVPDPNDPDLKYLEAGFTRYNTGAGRFLLRVTYTPVLLKDTATGSYYDPVTQNDAANALLAVPTAPGKYLKIESIGREGTIDPQDPTTFTNNRSSDRLQAYQVAYKSIGITDYARFITNPDSRSETANLGVTSRYYAPDTDGQIATPGAYDFNSTAIGNASIQQYPVITTYGAADAFKTLGGLLVPNPAAGGATTIPAGGTILAGGGSIHANMPIRFFGKNVVYLNDAGVNAPLYQDGVEIAGDLLLNGYQDNVKLDNSGTSNTGQVSSLIMNPTDLTNLKSSGKFIVPSNGQSATNGTFDTRNGLIRDGSTATDAAGLPRGIGRLEPPLMDAQDTSSRLPRYKAVATLSPPRIDPESNTPNTPYAPGSGQYGYGQSIYINNPNDIQQNSRSIGGGSTLIDQWLNRTVGSPDPSKGGWNGDFYEPPGVNITLGRQIVMRGTGANAKPTVAFGLRMTLTNTKWPNPDGTPGPDSSKTVLFDDINASNDPKTYTGANADNDVLVYAEGNVRVHGIASADPADKGSNLPSGVDTDLDKDKLPRHITIVTNGTAYIEGSLLKGNPDSTITVLAHDYVCVNTTQFLAGPQSDDNSLGTPPPFTSNEYLTFGEDDPRLIQEFTAGLPNGGTPGGPNAAYPSPLGLYVSARSGAGSPAQADFDIVNPVTGFSIRGTNVEPFGLDTVTNTTSIQSATFGPGDAAATGFGQQYFSLDTALDIDNTVPTPTPLSELVESDVRLLETRRNPGSEGAQTSQDVELERVAILPMDIRIEAVLYAQTGSFFVIPGPWFNSNAADTLDQFTPSVTSTNPNGLRTSGADSHFPFYGQPIDMKIIVSGAVSEAQPADVANQTAWMLKWGWIPQYHGFASAGTGLEPAGHTLTGKPAIGLQIIYNPQAGYPYHPKDPNVAGDTPYYLRSDAYGRPLPFSPKLPTSAGLLFSGASSEPPLLQ